MGSETKLTTMKPTLMMKFVEAQEKADKAGKYEGTKQSLIH